jgi:ParB-like chromosome segregation protein Spo0J
VVEGTAGGIRPDGGPDASCPGRACAEQVSPAFRRRPHPLCELFPAMEGAAFDELVASIKENGLQEPIVLLDDAILDGRNRYNACLAAGINPPFVRFRGDDPVRFVLAANVHRRHLNDSQRAMLAAQVARLPIGANQHAKKEGASIEAPSQSEAAEMLNVSRSSVQRAHRVFEHGAPEDVKAIREGKATVSGVAEKLKPPPAAPKPKPAATKPTRRVVSRDDLPPDAQLTNAMGQIITRAMEVFEPKFREWLTSKHSAEAKQDMHSIMHASGESLIAWSHGPQKYSTTRRKR